MPRATLPAVIVLSLLALGLGAVALTGVVLHVDPNENSSLMIGFAGAALTFGWYKAKVPAGGVLTAGGLGIMLMSKPWAQPIEGTDLDGAFYELGPMAERHLYPLVTGLALVAVAWILVAMAGQRRR